MSFDDELLLTTLGGALETRPAQPSATELADFRAVVTGAGLGEVLPFPEPVAPRRRHAVLVAAALVALLTMVGVGVLAAGQPLPNSLRSPVRALGIPVDDAAVAHTRTAMAELRAALDSTDDVRVEAAALALAARLRSLSGADFAEVASEARALLQVADARLSGGGLGRVHADSAVPPPSPATAPAAAEGDTGGAASSDGGQVVTAGDDEVEVPESEEPETSEDTHDSSDGLTSESVESSSPGH